MGAIRYEDYHGLDLAKSIFQVHGVDATGQVVVRKSLRRSQMLPFFAELPSCLALYMTIGGHGLLPSPSLSRQYTRLRDVRSTPA
jgi:transposase